MSRSIPKSAAPAKRKLSAEARAAMSAGAKKARAAGWGLARKPSVQIRIDADVAEILQEVVPAKDRRTVASEGVRRAVNAYRSDLTLSGRLDRG